MTTKSKHWQEIVSAKRLLQSATIPKDWILKRIPPKETLNVTNIPEECGQLTDKEVEITNSEVDVLLDRLSKGVWSAVEVTTAFSRRAIVAHQLVCHLFIPA